MEINMSKKIPVIICAALCGSGTMKNMNPNVPYTLKEYAEEAHKCRQSGAVMLHVHARTDDGQPTHEIDRVRAIYEGIKERCPDVLVCLSSAVGQYKTPEQRINQIIAVRPEIGSLNTNSMNFSLLNRKTGEIISEYLFDNTFSMLQNFGKAMEANGIKPEIECYDLGGIDNTLIIAKQGFFSQPMNFNFVWGVIGGQKFRPEAMIAMVNALPPGSNFTSCGVGTEQFAANTMSCLMGGHMRVGLEDNLRVLSGELAKGSYEQVEWAVKVAALQGRSPATPVEAREIMGIRKK
jgi:3-keto-5-aminohexanoate cleavage enzyme